MPKLIFLFIPRSKGGPVEGCAIFDLLMFRDRHLLKNFFSFYVFRSLLPSSSFSPLLFSSSIVLLRERVWQGCGVHELGTATQSSKV
jgi:hypothetical protein